MNLIDKLKILSFFTQHFFKIIFLVPLLVISCGSRNSVVTKPKTTSPVENLRNLNSQYTGKNASKVIKILAEAEDFLGTPYKFGGKTKSGLDCSGFVTWAMLNGGFESGDVGSGNEELIKNELYDLGEHHEITTSYMKDGNYKPGDYIASDGHAALIVGVDEKYVYVAEAYYADVKVSKFEKYYELPNLYSLTFIIEMDKIYPNGDGLTTMMWE